MSPSGFRCWVPHGHAELEGGFRNVALRMWNRTVRYHTVWHHTRVLYVVAHTVIKIDSMVPYGTVR